MMLKLSFSYVSIDGKEEKADTPHEEWVNVDEIKTLRKYPMDDGTICSNIFYMGGVSSLYDDRHPADLAKAINNLKRSINE